MTPIDIARWVSSSQMSRLRHVCRFGAFMAAVFAAGIGCLPADAAVRRCGPSISSGRQTAPSEAEARQLAMAYWIAGAARLGQGYVSWRLAHNRSLTCQSAANVVACEARGAPCVVEQVPERDRRPNDPVTPRPARQIEL